MPIPTEIKTVKDLKDWLSQYPDDTHCFGSDARGDGAFPLLGQGMLRYYDDYVPNEYEEELGMVANHPVVFFECDCF